jgi:MOSC domain-containing protein YiiM
VGRTRSNIEQEERVCFTIMEMGRLLPADEALEFSVEYAGVVIFGKAALVHDGEQAKAALQMLLDKYAPHLRRGVDYRPPIDEELKRTAVYRIAIESWSAKKKEVADFPTAYWYPEEPILASVRTRARWQGSVGGIFIAPKPAEEAQAVESAEAVVGRGLRGDRYYEQAGTFSDKGGTGREVTLIAAEDIAAFIREEEMQLSAQQSRRNILTYGVPLNALIDKPFWVGEVLLIGRRFAEPCDHLAKITGIGPKLLRGLHHRGGLRADIIQGGIIRVGDVVRPSD